jgi:hypothetical protein
VNWFHLMRMAQWARNPPSPARMKFTVGIVVICLAIFCIERWVGWPNWIPLDAERVPNRILR